MIALKMIKIVTVHWHGFRDVPGYDNAGYEIADPIEGHMHCDVIVLGRNTYLLHEKGTQPDILQIFPSLKECKCLTLPRLF